MNPLEGSPSSLDSPFLWYASTRDLDSTGDRLVGGSLVRGRPVRRARKELRKYKSMVRKLQERVNDKVTNPKVVKSKATTVVMSLAKVSHPNEAGQVDKRART